MNNEIQLISDGDGLAVIGDSTDVERFLLDQGLDRIPSKELDMHRLWSLAGTGGAAAQVGADIALNSGRWVKLTAESADAVSQFGLMATKTPGISHAMIGNPGDIQQWLQIAQGPSMLLGGPMALVGLSAMMQQQAMQRQMDEIVEYLQEISEKVDDILRSQKDAVLADMIGVDLIIEEAFTVRDQVGRVSEITWSKVQSTSMIIGRTQAYALCQLDAIAEKLKKKSEPGEIAKAVADAEPRVREWLAVLARCFQLQDGIAVLELDRVFDASPEELDQHRIGLTTARHNRLELIARSTARLLSEMHETVQKANSKVLFNPFKSPAAVRSSNHVASDLLTFRARLGIESSQEASEARRWGHAATEARDKVLTNTAAGVDVARRFGADTFDRAAEALRPADVDANGVADEPQALPAVDDASSAIKGATGAKGLATGAAGAVGSLFKRKQDAAVSPKELDPETADKPSGV